MMKQFRNAHQKNSVITPFSQGRGYRVGGVNSPIVVTYINCTLFSLPHIKQIAVVLTNLWWSLPAHVRGSIQNFHSNTYHKITHSVPILIYIPQYHRSTDWNLPGVRDMCCDYR